LVQVAGKSLAALGPLRVEINIAYGWKWKRRAGSAVGLMKVTLTIESFKSQIELQCFVEGVTGKRPGLFPF
jgi:hypothetical protein